jgi:tRNA A-37 threonylcarbamoyl transferase component Bud32/membrane-associated phospholipid phosphatase
MEVPADQSTQMSGPPMVPPMVPGTLRPVGRRRPSGEPPALPHQLQTSGVGWLLAAVVLVALAMVVFSRGLRGPAVAVTVADDAVVRWLAGLDAPGLVAVKRALAGLSSWWILNTLVAGLVLALLALRRFRHLVVLLIFANVVVLFADNMVGATVRRPRPFGVVIQTSWGGWALPSLQVTFFATILVAILYTLVPEGRWRNTGKWVAAALVALTALGRVALGAEGPTDVLVAAAIGVTIPLLTFRWFTPNEAFPVAYRRGRSAHLDVGGARGQAIRRGLKDQLDLAVQDVKPFGLAGSAGSTPLRITVAGDPPTVLFAKLYARSHLRADRWYKLGRELLYGRLEDERPFNTVRRLVQQEDYALRLCRDAGLPSPKPYGFVELTPEREYLLVTEFFDGAVELGEAEVDDQVIDDGLGIVRRLWGTGLAHRDLKPANLLVRDHQVLLIDVAFVEARPSPWRQAVDLANMMLCLGLRSSPERVYERALRQFNTKEISEGFAAARGLALPSQLRRLLRAQGRDLHGEFLRLLPAPPRPVSIQRWSARRIGLWALLAVLLVGLGVPMLGISLNNYPAFETRIYNVGTLACTDLEPLWLEAQSVPSASLVPCLGPLPEGWEVARMTVNDGRSVITLHDHLGLATVVVRLTADCDVRGASLVPPVQPEVRRYLRTESVAPQYSATRFEVFPGGCVTTWLTVPDVHQERVTSQAGALLGLTSRQTLQQLLEQRSDGRLRLDPDGHDER